MLWAATAVALLASFDARLSLVVWLLASAWLKREHRRHTRSRDDRFGRPFVRLSISVCCLGLVVFAAGREPAISGDPHHIANLAAAVPNRTHEITARVIDVGGSIERRRLRLTVETLSTKRHPQAHGRFNLFVRNPRAKWWPGDRLHVSVRLSPIENSGNPWDFDWQGYWARRGIFVAGYLWTGRIDVGGIHRDLLTRLAGEEVIDGPARTRVAKAALRDGGRGAPIVAALITGDRRYLSERFVAAMRACGLSHLLAISGMHVGLVVGAVFGFANFCLVRSRFALGGFDTIRVAVLIGLIALGGYGRLAGSGVSIARAELMAGVALASVWRGVRLLDLHVLAAAALVLTVAIPGVAREPAFQLSFGAVLAIFVSLRRHPELGAARAAILLSFVCWRVTAPIAAFHFGELSLVGPLTNLLASPLAAATVGAGLLGALISGASEELAALCFLMAGVVAFLLERFVLLFAALPLASVNIRFVTGPIALLLVLPALDGGLVSSNRYCCRAVCLAALLMLVAYDIHARFPDRQAKIVFADVGQGDATVVVLPRGRVLVVDAGTPGRGTNTVSGLLRTLNVSHIDYLALSHAQQDHAGGAADLFDEFTVGEIWEPGGICEADARRRLMERAARQSTLVRTLGARCRRIHLSNGPGEVTNNGPCIVALDDLGDWQIEALWPEDENGDCRDNNRSLVLRVVVGTTSLLLTGDIERQTEAALLARRRVSPTSILKVAHHGSSTSSTQAFIESARPEVAVASAGRKNRYGFPHGDVVERFVAMGSEFFSTERDGAIVISFGSDPIQTNASGAR